jgi:3-deoxy-D-manno-octulosonic-acid transferase
VTLTETLYRAATALAEPLAPAALAWRARGEPADLRDERLARCPLPPVDTWWHAASLGEIAALEPVLAQAIDRGQAGRFLVTVTTAAGREAAQSRWPGRAVLAPLDLPGAAAPAVRERAARAFISG